MNEQFELKKSSGGIAFFLAFLVPSIFSAIALSISASIISATKGISLAEAMYSDTSLFISIFVTQMTMLAVAVFVTKGFRNIPRLCKIQRVEKKTDIIMSVVLALGVFCGLTILSSLFMEFLGLFGYTPTASPFPSMTSWGNYLLGILFIAIMPAFIEEVIFRGIILNSIKSFGKWGSILFSALLFTLLHSSPMQTIYQFAYGVIFGIIAYETKSLIPTIIMHGINNFLAITFEFMGYGDISFPIYLIIIGIAIMVVSLIYFLKWRKGKNTQNIAENEISKNTNQEVFSDIESVNEILKNEKKAQDRIEKLQCAVFYGIAILACSAMWIINFTSGL